MAKAQSFADKAAKLAAKKDQLVMCPDTKKGTRIIDVRLVRAVKTADGHYKYFDRNSKVYESTYKPYVK